MFSRLAVLRTGASPTVRGALFYLSFWGSVGMYGPFVNVYFLKLGLTGAQLSTIAVLGPLTILLFNSLIGSLADRRGWRMQLLLVALGCMAISQMLMSMPRSFAAILPVSLMLSLARGPVQPLGDSLVASMAVRHKIDFGKLRLWGSIGYAVAALVGGELWLRTGYTAMFLVTGIATALVILFASNLENAPPMPKVERRSLATVGGDRGLFALVVVSGLVGAAFGMVIFDGPLIASLGGERLLGVLPFIIATCEVPVMLYADRVMRRLSSAKTLLLATTLLGLGFVGAGLATQAWMLIPLGVVRATGFGLYVIGMLRLITGRTPPALLASVQGLVSAIGGGLAPLVATKVSGLIYDWAGPGLVYVVAGSLVLSAGLVFLMAMLRGWFERPPAFSNDQ